MPVARRRHSIEKATPLCRQVRPLRNRIDSSCEITRQGQTDQLRTETKSLPRAMALDSTLPLWLPKQSEQDRCNDKASHISHGVARGVSQVRFLCQVSRSLHIQWVCKQ